MTAAILPDGVEHVVRRTVRYLWPMARSAANTEGLPGLLRLAQASVDHGGPRPAALTVKFLRALLATGTLPARDAEIIEQLLAPKRRLGERVGGRTTSPLHTFACVNCDSPAADAPWVYCSPLCAEMAGTVRYGRRVRADGRIADPEVADALRIRLAMVTGGGYPAEARRLRDEQRSTVIERAGGRCQECGQPGSEIDHIGRPIDGDINHPDNLQLLCSTCHRAKTIATFRPATEPQQIARAFEMRRRISAKRPTRPCDDVDRWPEVEREMRRHRRAEFVSVLEELARPA